MNLRPLIAIATLGALLLTGCVQSAGPENESGILLPIELPSTPAAATQPGETIEPGHAATFVGQDAVVEVAVLGTLQLDEENADFAVVFQMRESGRAGGVQGVLKFVDEAGNDLKSGGAGCAEAPVATYPDQRIYCYKFLVGDGPPLARVEYVLTQNGSPLAPVVLKLP